MAGAVRSQGFRSPLARSTACLLYVARSTGYHRARHSTNRGQNSKWQGAGLVAVRTHPMRALANARVAPCRGYALHHLPRSCAAPVRELDVAGAVRSQGFRSPLARSTACLLYVARSTGYHRARHQAME